MGKVLVFLIVGFVIVLLLGGVGAYFYVANVKTTPPKTDSTSTDGLASLSATFYDFSGSSNSGVTQALIGGTAKKTHVKFEIKASNTGTVSLVNVMPINPNSNMGGALNNVDPLATLNVGQSNIIVGTSSQACTSNADCDSNEQCCNVATSQCNVAGNCFIALDNYASANSGVVNNLDFTISLQAKYRDAQGNLQTVTSSPVKLTYDIRSEKCSDGTSINSCVFQRSGIESDKPKYCSFSEGTAPIILDKSSVCGCPTNYQVSGESCIPQKCSDNTPIGSCSTVTHEGTYGAYMFCNTDKTLIPDCNICGATTDYYGNAKTGCTPSSGRPSSAVYNTYSGQISGSLNE